MERNLSPGVLRQCRKNNRKIQTNKTKSIVFLKKKKKTECIYQPERSKLEGKKNIHGSLQEIFVIKVD